MEEIWSGRRGSNPRPRPWQGRALPLSYTRIRAGGERSPSTADLCQMRTVNATVRVRSVVTRIIRFHQQTGANRSETTPKRDFVDPLSPRREPKVRPPTRPGAIRGIFEPAFPVNSSHTPQSQSEVPWLTSTGHRRSRGVPADPVSDDPDDACRLNFVAKPPSSGGGTSSLAVLEGPEFRDIFSRHQARIP